jgi:hypothetical protein
MRALLLLPVLFFGLCACNEARVAPTARAQALRDREPREVKVVRVWSQVGERLEQGADPHISHYIEVDVLAGPGAGKPLTLPYDQWNTGRPAPEVGERMMMAPADWVERDARTPGRPYGH